MLHSCSLEERIVRVLSMGLILFTPAVTYTSCPHLALSRPSLPRREKFLLPEEEGLDEGRGSGFLVWGQFPEFSFSMAESPGEA